MRRCRDMVRWAAGAFCVASGWLVVSQAVVQKEPQEYTIRTTSRLVLLDVSVKDSAGGLISGLTSDNFKVYEDGKLQQVTQFAHADIPVTVGLVVDKSGSMRPKQPEVITAGLVFIQASNPQDEIFVVNFNEAPRLGLPELMLFSDDLARLKAALWQGDPQGRTALYDAIEMALHHLSYGQRDKKTLIVISDGGDNVSAHTLHEVMRDLLESATTIYTIGIFDEDDPDRNPKVLNGIARVSGGSAYFPQKLSEIVPICRDIAKDIRSRYTVGYIPAVGNRTSVRHIKVEAKSATGRKLIVRTRTSYLFTPDTDEASSK